MFVGKAAGNPDTVRNTFQIVWFNGPATIGSFNCIPDSPDKITYDKTVEIPFFPGNTAKKIEAERPKFRKGVDGEVRLCQ